ncbi:MAG: NADPH-dependent glutamate synthase [Candidatus Eisenbacteria bacterium]|uniref:NADPH-dependent glutamate synthase n=1 Tax=Eiseniibacteriota bacterium TaxID=2212470 RepID=A0A948WCK6_UNCEI|nr:NADPH-dependent glutamate synthase [Candidatus Eisenbacteria bacterium]MBU1951257.1 NADPH-dependent glutamate synthase [Candidatus Eisenbacteria bacterium]MBU2691013.1 NADPH-dependent glutamate synthase [Candidatus Eisenbacteria bacterium]
MQDDSAGRKFERGEIEVDSTEKKAPETKPKKVKIPRQPMPEQDPKKRSREFTEVALGYSADMAVLEASRCIQCKKPLCVSGCPVGIDIPGFIRLISEKDFRSAVRLLKQMNILPAICGRVCPQETQCEAKCILGKKGEPVAIGRLERFLADWERESDQVDVPKVAPPTGKKVAIVGSGPAGLTAAVDCARMGHEVEVFEALHKPGGVLIYGIPEFRLPNTIVEAEVNILKKMGVKIHCNYVVGRIETIDEMLERFDAIFVGTGAGLPVFMHIPGENLIGVYSANEYLTRSNLMHAYDFPSYDTPLARGGVVATIGGGNVAMDSARTALRLGAERSLLIYRRGREEMPARHEEIEHAEAEGVELFLLTSPTRVLGNDKGRVKALECVKMELGEPDAGGRRRPVVIEGSEHTYDVNTIVVAIGNGPNPLIPQTTPDIQIKRWGNIEANEATGKTNKRGVFAGGDIVLGAATVILAMGAGQTAAKAIDEYLKTGIW